mgnify:CR=1 FL=1
MKLKVKHIPSIMLCIYIVVVAVLCFMKTDSLPSVELHFLGIPIDKLAHFIMFVPFPVLAYMTFWPTNAGKPGKMGVLIVIMAAGTGLAKATERIQSMLSYRTEDPMDFMADMTGILIGSLIIAAYILLKKENRK